MARKRLVKRKRRGSAQPSTTQPSSAPTVLESPPRLKRPKTKEAHDDDEGTTTNEQRKAKSNNTEHDNDKHQKKRQSRMQLEEEIVMMEQSIGALSSRKQTIDQALDAVHSKRKGILQTLAGQIQRKQQLDESQDQHLNLLQELQKSLTKGRDILMRLDDRLTPTKEMEESSLLVAEDIQNQEQEQDLQVDDGFIEAIAQSGDDQDHEEAVDADAAHESKDNDDVEEKQESVPSFRSCPVPSIHNDRARLEAFWNGHSDVRNSHTLFAFSPCVSSEATLVKMMNVTAMEAMAEDAWLGPNNLQASADYRRQTLWNTCLDFNLMVGRGSDVADRYDGDGGAKTGGQLSSKDDTNAAENAETIDTEQQSESSGRVARDAELTHELGMGNTDLDDGHHGGNVVASRTVESRTEPDDSFHLDPNVALCPYELAGVCADPLCPFQHLNVKDRPANATILPRELLPLPQLRLPDEPACLESSKQSLVLSEKEGNTPEIGIAEGQTERDNKVHDPSTAGSPDKDGATEAEEIIQSEHADFGHQKPAVDDTTDENNQASDQDSDPTDVENAGARAAIHLNQEDGSVDIQGDESSDTSGARATNHATTEDFESNLDFVALGEVEDDDMNDEEEDFMNLETAGLVGLTREQAPGLQKGRAMPNEDKRPFWWLPSSVESAASPTKQMGLEDWLHLYGDFRVTRSQERDSDEDNVAFECHCPSPTGHVELCEFTGKVVDCARLLLQAGRFDLSGPLCTLAQDDLADFTAKSVYGPLLPSAKMVVEIFRKVLEVTSSILESAYCRQNGFATTLSFQLTLALVSDFLFRFHTHLTVEAELDEASLARCHDFLEESTNLVGGCDPENPISGELGDKTVKSAHYIRETIKLTVFRDDSGTKHRRASDSTEYRDGGFADPENEVSSFERVTSSLLDDIKVAFACSAAIRSGFSLHSVAEDFLKPIWAVIKTSLRPRKRAELNEAPRSTVCLRSYIFIGYILMGTLQGAVEFLKSVAGDPHRLSALSFSSLVQLDVTCHGILKSLKPMVSANVDTRLLSTFLTPIMGASVAFSCHLGMYTKAQLRLEELLGNPSKGTGPTSFFTYSELLWSQLVHLRASLPFSQAELSENHKQIASKICVYGLHVHHLSLSGDWKIISRLGAIAHGGKPTQAVKRRKVCTWLLGTATKPLAVGLRNLTPLPAPASLRRIESVRGHPVTFPRSLLVHGWKISTLHLEWCELRELPHSLGLHMPNLKELDISHNRIEFFPDSIGNMKLEILMANGNLLKSLPKVFAELSNLRVLELSDNSLESFPGTIWKLKHLEELKLSGNNFLMMDSAQLALELPKLRELSTHAVGAAKDD